MAKTDAVAAAYRRKQILTNLLKWVREQCDANPHKGKWAELGLMSAYENKSRSKSELDATFDELFGLVEHLGVLDMAASFEMASRARLRTRIGEARSLLKAAGRKGNAVEHFVHLLRESESIDDLGSVESVAGRFVDEALIEQLSEIRKARNNFAHGTDILASPAVDAEQTRDNLSAILNLL